MDPWLNFVNTVYGGERCTAAYILRVKQVLFQRSCLTGVSGPFYSNFNEYEMLIEREICLLSLLFWITVNSPLRIQFFSQHKDFITVKFAMGCIQRNEKLVVRSKIRLTAKQFWNESRWILRTRGPCCCCQVHKIFRCKRIERPLNLRVDEFNEIQS